MQFNDPDPGSANQLVVEDSHTLNLDCLGFNASAPIMDAAETRLAVLSEDQFLTAPVFVLGGDDTEGFDTFFSSERVYPYINYGDNDHENRNSYIRNTSGTSYPRHLIGLSPRADHLRGWQKVEL